MKTCYVCGMELSDDGTDGTVKRHKEHIIHNGIHGKLKSSSILCEKCGSGYSKNDADFVNLFAGFIELLRDILIAKDHGAKNPKRLKGFLYLPENAKADIEFCGGKVYPTTPYYRIDEESKTIHIYGNKKRCENYLNVILQESPEYSHYDVQMIDNLSSLGNVGLFFSEDNQDFNRIFREGLCKIATEFALSYNVAIDDLPLTLKVGCNNTSKLIGDKVSIVPYVPQSASEMILALIEDYVDLKYPIHALRLYSELDEKSGSQRLLCYIELFSTFKYYVLLNPNYNGVMIDKFYCQNLLSEQGSEIKINGLLEDKMGRAYQVISEYIKLQKLPNILFDVEVVAKLIDEAISNEGLEQFINEILDSLKSENYMKNTIYHYEDAESSCVSTFALCANTTMDIVRTFTFSKFNQLNRFCWNYNKIIEERNHVKCQSDSFI